MIQAVKNPIVMNLRDDSSPACGNSAVSHCCDGWELAFQEEMAKGEDDVIAAIEADEAYRGTLPPLAGHENICDFIACVAHGMLIGAISESCGTKLLYAAQVANGADRQQPDARKSEAA